MSYDIFTGLLKLNNELTHQNESFLSYEFNDPSLEILRQGYKIDEVAGTGTELSKALNLLHWISNHISHNGSSSAKCKNALEFMEYAFDKGEAYGINCAMLSNVLARCLMSIGIYAREVKLIPYSPYDFDSHRVIQVYINDLKKWIMLDPTYSSYAMNKNGEILGILEIRSLLAEQETIYFNQEINYNGQKMESHSEFYRQYLAKNTFCLATPNKMVFDSITNSELVYICPKDFNIKQRDLYNIEYRSKKLGIDLSAYLEETSQMSYHHISSELFISSPLS